MSSALLTTTSHRRMGSSVATAPIIGSYSNQNCRFMYEYNQSCLDGNEKVKKKKSSVTMIGMEKKKRFRFCAQASSTIAATRNSSPPNLFQEVLEAAREKFTQEISFQSKDKDISLAMALLYIAAEGEALIALNREIDVLSLQNERRNTSVLSTSQEWDSLDTMPLAGKNVSEWLIEMESIAEEVKAELVSREIGCHFGEVLEELNLILFETRGFKRPPVITDPKYIYLHSVLNSGYGSGKLHASFILVLFAY